MYVDTTSYLNSMQLTTQPGEPSGELGMDAFLSLFIAQLENQDPLDPMSDTEQLAQLAEFSSLEQLTYISDSLDGIGSTLGSGQMNWGVSYLGKDVMASGSGISVADGEHSSMTYTVPLNAGNVYANVFDENGNIVATLDLGARNAGEYGFEWDGTDYNGNTVDDGTYNVVFTAEDANGEAILVSSMVEGRVTGVGMENGSTVLELADGRSVKLENVFKVTSPGEAAEA